MTAQIMKSSSMLHLVQNQSIKQAILQLYIEIHTPVSHQSRAYSQMLLVILILAFLT